MFREPGGTRRNPEEPEGTRRNPEEPGGHCRFTTKGCAVTQWSRKSGIRTRIRHGGELLLLDHLAGKKLIMLEKATQLQVEPTSLTIMFTSGMSPPKRAGSSRSVQMVGPDRVWKNLELPAAPLPHSNISVVGSTPSWVH